MKDVRHHLKHVQKKVLQSARKEENHIMPRIDEPLSALVLTNPRRNNKLFQRKLK